MVTLKAILNCFRYPEPIWILKGKAKINLYDLQIEFDISSNRRIVNHLYTIYENKWEYNILKIFNDNLKKEDILFDIGAYIGLYSIVAAKTITQGLIHAFEPDPTAYKILKDTINLNKIKNINAIPLALSNNISMKYLSSKDFGNTGSQIHDAIMPYNQNVIVETSTLDNYCESINIKPSVIKLDVEGHELEVIRGGNKIVQDSRLILLELHNLIIKKQKFDPMDTFQQILEITEKDPYVLINNELHMLDTFSTIKDKGSIHIFLK